MQGRGDALRVVACVLGVWVMRGHVFVVLGVRTTDFGWSFSLTSPARPWETLHVRFWTQIWSCSS